MAETSVVEPCSSRKTSTLDGMQTDDVEQVRRDAGGMQAEDMEQVRRDADQ